MASTVKIQSFMNLVYSKQQVFLGLAYSIALIAGVTLIIWLKPLLEANDLACGKHAIALFVPFGSVGLVLALLVITDSFSKFHFLYIVLLYVVLMLLFTDLFFSPIWHYYFDDPGRYSNYAHFILTEGTLWGGDALGGMGANTGHYVDQPGFRYFLALMIKILGGEHRLMQLSNMLIYLVALLTFLGVARDSLSRSHFTWIAAFLILSLPYAANNILDGLSDWLAVTLFFFFVSLIIREQVIAAIVLLALIPFVRQNLLITSGLLVAFLVITLAKGKGRLIVIAVFIGILCLPIYHNLYYADEFRLLTTNRGNHINWHSFSTVMQSIFDLVIWKSVRYLGYHPHVDFLRTIVAVLFAPLGTGLLLYFLFRIRSSARYWYWALAAATVGPTILFGWGYFPRFVFTTQVIVLTAIPLLNGNMKVTRKMVSQA